MTKVDNEYEQLVSMLNQLLDEREVLSRENEYFKAKLNRSILIETIKEMKKERDLLFKLLTNLTTNNNNNKDEQVRIIKQQIKENNSNLLLSSSTFNGQSGDYKQNSILLHHNPTSTMNHARVYRLKNHIEQQPPPVVYRTENFIKNPDGLTSSSITHMKQSQTNQKILVYKTATAPRTQELNKLIRKHDIPLTHSQNSPFQHYRSQSLQDLT